MYVERFYRNGLNQSCEQRRISVRQTDLAVLLPPVIWQDKPNLEQKIYGLMTDLRLTLEDYIKINPLFYSSHKPLSVTCSAPPMAVAMARAAASCGVGPMAAVAGAFAQEVGEYLQQFAAEGLVENGGDIYLWGEKEHKVGIFAGKSPFSGQIALRLAGGKPLSVCTSSGTVGPSFSYGVADAAVLVAEDAYLADAAATATANLVQTADDVKKAADFAAKIPGICGALVIKDDKLAAWGNLEIVPIVQD